MNQKEIISLIALLDDDDHEILNHVEQKLMQLGTDIIPFLEGQWSTIHNTEHQQRIENIVHKIQFSDLLREFRQWMNSEDMDLLHGVYLVARYRFPELDKQSLSNAIDKLRMDAWLEMRYDYTPFEKVRILNYVMYTQHKYTGNTENYHDPSNSFINQVLESRKGNPIMLSVVYMLLAQRLHIPVFGVNLPQHFMLVFLEEEQQDLSHFSFDEKPAPFSMKPNGRPCLFYINAFNKGGVFTKANLEQFLKQIKIESKIEFFEPCSNLDIVKRVLRNLSGAYEIQGKTQKQREIQELLFTLGEPDISHFEDVTGFHEDDDE